MGFFSKLWDGVKGVFKKIGKGIKKVVGSVGKFVNKLGIVGQIGMMFILPGIGSLLSQGVGLLAGASNPLLAGVGKVLQTAGKFAHTAGNAFKTVTDGISGFVSKVGKGFVNSAAKAIGKDAVFKAGPQSISEGFSQWMQGVADDVSNITSPFKTPAKEVMGTVDTAFEKSLAPDESGAFSQPFEAPTVDTTFEGTFDLNKELVQSANQDFRFYEVPRPTVESIAQAEKTGLTGFMESTAQYAKETMMSLPEKAIDKTADAFSTGVATTAAQAVGLSPKPEYNVTNVTNPIPQFNSAPITNQYESAGINYGALPDNRIQFFAAQQNPFGDFGLTGFNQFSKLRTV